MAPNNPLSIWGNEKTMNLNTLILTNIQSSPYFKVNLYELKTYHEVIDEIYYKVSHLEPWEKGSRKTAGQTGMCGGVRGVGAGGIVSSAFCLLYKLFTLRLTKKQVNGLISHQDSPYIRALGFMYIRFTQPPQELWDWFEPYLDDEEEIDVKAGGGHSMTIGEMLRHWLTKLEWYCTLFPRIPVPTQKDLDEKMKARAFSMNQMTDGVNKGPAMPTGEEPVAEVEEDWHTVEQPVENNSKSSRSPERRRYDRPPRDKVSSSHQMSPLSKVTDKNRMSNSPHRKSPRSRSPHSRKSSPHSSLSSCHRKSPCHKYPPSSSSQQPLSSMDDFAVQLARERERQRRERERERNGRHKDQQQQQQQQQQSHHHHHHRHHHHRHRHHSSSKSKDSSNKTSSDLSPMKGAGMVQAMPKEQRASRSQSPPLATRSHNKKKKHSRKSHCKDRKRSKSPTDSKEHKRSKRLSRSRSHSRCRTAVVEDNGQHSNNNNNNNSSSSSSSVHRGSASTAAGGGDGGSKSRSHHKKEHSSSERSREKKAKKKKHSKSKENGEYYT